MINALAKPCAVSLCSDTKDAYGQKLDTVTAVKTVDISVALLDQTLREEMVQYKDATHFGLTTDKTITDKHRITYDSVVYDVLLVNNQGRYAHLTLRKR